MDEKVRAILAELRRRFDRLYGERLVQLVLYGSQARGDAEPGSDIDVLVVLQGLVSPTEEIDRTLDDVADFRLNATRSSPVSSCRRSGSGKSVAHCC